jgi:SAM-dependent methyltransferase
MDVVDLRDFYLTELGREAAVQLTNALRPLIDVSSDQTVLGLGFAVPYLNRLISSQIRQLAFMQARQGVIHWPQEGEISSALVDPHDLPLLESTIDLALVIHSLELSDDPQDVLQEIWRVLAPQVRLILVVPNRRGLWSAAENTPFGSGQPFSKGQLAQLLKDAQFTPLKWSSALYVPPFQWQPIHKAARFFEATGPYIAKGLSGVTIVEAQKQVYAFSSGKRARKLLPRLRPVLLPAPQPSRRTNET